MVATTRARGDTNGRMKRAMPQAPSGRQPKRRTFCTSAMDPNKTVPTNPIRPYAGVAGAVVPTPADCHPEKKWCQLADHPRSGANWPTIGSDPKKSSLVPIRTTRAATKEATTRWRPVLRKARCTWRPNRSRPER
jgi:hypothetical protein